MLMESFIDLTNVIHAYTYTCVRTLSVCMCMFVCDVYTEYRKHCAVSELITLILEKMLLWFTTVGNKRKVAKVCYCREKLIGV